MTPLYIDHSHPQVKAIMDAQEILRVARKALYEDTHRLSRAGDRKKASKAFQAVDNASLHLSEEVRIRIDWWIGRQAIQEVK